MVNLAFIGRFHALIPSADWELCHSHNALLDAGRALLVVEVDWPVIGVEKGRERSFFIDLTGDELVEVFRAGHRGAVGHLQGDFLAVTVENLRHGLQWYEDISL